MDRIKELGRYQMILLLLMAVMILAFTVTYPIVTARSGFLYEDTILVPSENVLCHTLFKNRLITGCINAGNFFYVGSGAPGNGIESVPLFAAGVLRGSSHEIDERCICRVLIFIDHALLYGRVLRRVRVYGSAFSVSVFPGQHVRHRPRRGALLHGVLPPSHQSESSRSSSSPSNSASKSG